jgi:hypothetical protein
LHRVIALNGKPKPCAETPALNGGKILPGPKPVQGKPDPDIKAQAHFFIYIEIKARAKNREEPPAFAPKIGGHIPGIPGGGLGIFPLKPIRKEAKPQIRRGTAVYP